MLDASSGRVDKEIFGAVCYQSGFSEALRRGWWGPHNVMAMPPVARMPQWIVFGADMIFNGFSSGQRIGGYRLWKCESSSTNAPATTLHAGIHVILQSNSPPIPAELRPNPPHLCIRSKAAWKPTLVTYRRIFLEWEKDRQSH
jgi:hypothetical protein